MPPAALFKPRPSPSFISNGNAGEAVRFGDTRLGKQAGRSALSSGVDGGAACRLASLRTQPKIDIAPPDDRAGKPNTDGAGKLSIHVSIPPRSFAAVHFAN